MKSKLIELSNHLGFSVSALKHDSQIDVSLTFRGETYSFIITSLGQVKAKVFDLINKLVLRGFAYAPSEEEQIHMYADTQCACSMANVNLV